MASTEIIVTRVQPTDQQSNQQSDCVRDIKVVPINRLSVENVL